MSVSAQGSGTVVLTTVPSDAHTWNLVYLGLLLEEHGYTVVNLGNCPTPDVVRHAARDPDAIAVVVSTVNGLGALDGARLVAHLRADMRLAGLPIAIGGKLGTTGHPVEQDVARLYSAGASRVFGDADAPSSLLTWLAEQPNFAHEGRVVA